MKTKIPRKTNKPRPTSDSDHLNIKCGTPIIYQSSSSLYCGTPSLAPTLYYQLNDSEKVCILSQVRSNQTGNNIIEQHLCKHCLQLLLSIDLIN